MARPERNNVDYFPFYCEDGKKMFYIEETYGNDGFATFLKILRELAKTEYHYLNLSKNTTLMFLSAKCKISRELLENIIGDLVELGKFNAMLWNENKIIWCQDFIDSVQDAYKKRNNDCITLEGLLHLLNSLGIRKLGLGETTVPVKPQRKEEEIKEKKTKEEERKENDLDPSEIDFSGVDPDNLLINKILKNFNFNEVTNIDKMKEAWSFLKCIHLADRVQYFESQMDAYFDYKKLTNGLDFIHSFKNFLGSHDKLFTDGAWNQENWIAKLETEKTTKQNGKANQSNLGRRSHINPPTNSYSKL
jgi:hypothetical protein